MPVTREQKRPTKYEINENGGRPFSVTVSGKSITVSKNTESFVKKDGRYIYHAKSPKYLFSVQADEVWIGKRSPNGSYDGLTPSQADGNSILLKIGAKYMYIGHQIYEFSPVKGDTILKYYSNIGNSDVPYPYAIGKTHIYIMLENVAIEKSYFDMKKDIYEQHYYEHRIHMCLVGNPRSDICKDASVYQPKIEEWKAKTVKLPIKLLY